MTGRTPQICLAQYNNAKRLLARRFIEFVLEHEKLEPETVKMLESDLEQIGGVELIDLGLGTGWAMPRFPILYQRDCMVNFFG